MASIIDHPSWPVIRRYFRINFYEREPTPANPRWRIEVDEPADSREREQLLRLVAECPACGASYFPIRARQGPVGSLYFAAACPREARPGCSKGRAATDEYIKVRRDLDGCEPPVNEQPELF